MNDKIIIVDNSILFADAMGLLIEKTFNKQVVAKLTFGDKLINKFEKFTPGLALIAFDSKVQNQHEKIQELMEQFSETVFIALVDSKENNYHTYVKEQGYKGFINKLNFIKDFKAVLDSFVLIPE
jgi:DNA-binding NarL/FixJ family response regulator